MSPLPPNANAFNLADYVMSAGRLTPNKTALSLIGPNSQKSWTFGELDDAILRTATALQDAGLSTGDRLLLRIGNEIAFPIVFLAAITVGIIPVPTSVGLTKGEISKVSQALRPAFVVASDGVPRPDGVPFVLADQLLRASHSAAKAETDFGDAHRPGYMILTSGTSGTPRLVVHAHRAVWARRYMWDGWYGLTDQDQMAHAGAFNWTYTLGTGLMDPWAIGATALIPFPGQAPADLPPLLRDHGATIFAAAPGVFRQMLRTKTRLNIPTLRHGLTAGEKCPDVTRQTWEDLTGTQLHEAFGQSEISTFISGSPNRPAPQGTLGFPQNGRRVKIVDDSGLIVENGATGTIAVHCDDPGLMLRLWEDPSGTNERLRGDWYLTGDTGHENPDGSITYHGRSDDMLNSGGFRVSPLEIEQTFCTHPDISEAAAVDHAVKEDAKVIALHYVAPTPIDDSDLSAFAQSRLAPYKRPRLFVHHDHLPRNPNGKLLRRSLREN